MHVCLYILVRPVRTLFEWVEELRSKMLDGMGDWMIPLHLSYSKVLVSVSVLRLLSIFWGFRFWLRKIWCGKKSLSIDFRKFGLRKKPRFRKIWSRKTSHGFGIRKFGLVIGLGQNLGLVIQWLFSPVKVHQKVQIHNKTAKIGQNRPTFCVICAKKGTGLKKKVHHRWLWRLWQISGKGMCSL